MLGESLDEVPVSTYVVLHFLIIALMACEEGSEKMGTRGGYGIGILDGWWLGASEEPKKDDEAGSVQSTVTGRSSV